jgi:hypothetical protein
VVVRFILGVEQLSEPIEAPLHIALRLANISSARKLSGRMMLKIPNRTFVGHSDELIRLDKGVAALTPTIGEPKRLYLGKRLSCPDFGFNRQGDL